MRVRTFAAALLVALGAHAAAQGRATVTFFIASDCPISNAYAPEISRICSAYQARGASCRLVYEDTSLAPADLMKHISEYGLMQMRATWDSSRTLADHSHVTITPTAVVADGRDKVQYQGRIDNLYINIGRTRQQVTNHDVTDALDAVLARKPVPHPQTEPLGCYIERR
jgi:hypothetical protein